jgi:hypothetical protein
LQAIRVNKFGGIPFTAGEILQAIEEVGNHDTSSHQSHTKRL